MMADDDKKQKVKETYQWATQALVYGTVLTEMAAAGKDIVVLTADVSNSTGTKGFSTAFPERFFNFGLAENNMFAAAAGLAIYGKRPYVSTFAAFGSLRCAEMIRTDIAYPNLPVRIIMTHAGVSMGNGGTTHHATEDIAILRSMANMIVMVPADAIETRRALEAAASLDGPVSFRLGRGLDPMVYDVDDYDFRIGKGITMRDWGNDAAVFSCGVCVSEAIGAADDLHDEGINVKVINMHTIKPLDTECIIRSARATGAVVTAEEHTTIGGLGGAVAETLADAGIGIKFMRLGLPDVYSAIGPPADLRKRYFIDRGGIKQKVRELVSSPRP
jgi:transketolase